jgi:hypothetical protein
MPLIQGPVAFTTVPRLDGERLAGQAVAHLGAAHAAVDVTERDDLRVVRDRATSVGRGADVGEAEPPVVRERVDVDAAAAQALERRSGTLCSARAGGSRPPSRSPASPE